MELPTPRRPQPTNPRAKLALEWADVSFYIFWLVLIAVALVLALVTYGPTLLGALR